MARPGRARVVGTFAVLTLIWGTTWAAIRVGLRGIPPFTGVAARFAIASVVLLALCRAMKIPLGRAPHEKTLWVVNTLFSFCFSYSIVYWAEQWVPSGLSSVLFATFPLFVGILAHLFLPAERLRLLAALGTLLGFAGVAVIFSEDFTLLGGPHVAFAAAVMLLSPLSSAVASVAVKKWGAGVHPLSVIAVPIAATAVIMGIVAFLIERNRPVVLDAASVGALLYLALAGTALTFSLYFWLLRHLPATQTSLIAYTVPIIAVTVGALVMDEPVTPRTLAGSALVIAGVALAVRSRPRIAVAPEEIP